MNLGDKLYMIGSQGFGSKIVMYDTIKDICMEPLPISDSALQSNVIYINDTNTKKDLLYFLGWNTNIAKYAKDEILCYDVQQNVLRECNDFKLPLRIRNFGCVTTYNQRYIILFGGDCTDLIPDQHGVKRIRSDRIYVLDLKLKQFQECTLRCPEVGAFEAVLMSFCEDDNAQDLIIGFVRNYMNRHYKDKLEKRIPMDIVGLIGKFCQNEYIYLIEKQQIFPKHWKICVDDILNSMNAVC